MLCNKLSMRCIIMYSIAMMEMASSFSVRSATIQSRFSQSSKQTEAIESFPREESCLFMTNSKDTQVSTLTEETTWRLRFALNNVPTKSGKKVGELFVAHIQFVEEAGFEPPQGVIKQVFPDKQPEEVESNTGQNISPRVKIKSGRWKLSEDPEDRKDGLWVWGLFKEPLYPFMLLQIETDEYPISGLEGDCLKPLVLYAQVNHKRDKGTGNVELGVAALNLREVEKMKADPFGATFVDIFEDIKVGQLTFRPYDASEVRN